MGRKDGGDLGGVNAGKCEYSIKLYESSTARTLSCQVQDRETR